LLGKVADKAGEEGNDMITVKIILLVMLVTTIVACAYATERSALAKQPQA
jgi:hypothetical protein